MSWIDLVAPPPRATARLLLAALTVQYLFRAVTSNLWGVLSVALCVYVFRSYASLSPPFSAAELALWFDALEKEHQAAIVGGLIASVGLFVAFTSAIGATRVEARLRLELEAAGEMQALAEAAGRCLTTLRIAAEFMLEVKHAAASGDQEGVRAGVAHIYDQAESWKAAKTALLNITLGAHALVGKHGLVLLSKPRALEGLQDVSTALDEVMQRSHFLIPDRINHGHFDQLAIAANINAEKIQAFLATEKENSALLQRVIGSVRGALIDGISPIPLHVAIPFIAGRLEEVTEQIRMKRSWRAKRKR